MDFSACVNPKWFINLSDTEIPNEVCWLLSLGAKFSLPMEQKEFPMFNFIADVENILTNEQEEEARELKRSKISNILNKERFKNQVDNPIDAKIVRIHKLTKKFFKLNKNLIITAADKGNRTVVMNKADYKSKILKLLTDPSTYKQFKFDTTDALKARLVHITSRLVSNGCITAEDWDKMSMHNVAMAKAYGLPKIHKPDIPLRLLVASYESPADNVSKYLANILKNLTKNSKYNVKNSFEVMNRISKQKCDEEILHETCSEIEAHTSIPEIEFFQLLNFVLRDCNQFIYDNVIYKQLDGVPMGLPLSPILADIVMEYVLDEANTRLPFKLEHCIKYVDDLFLTIPSHLIDVNIMSTDWSL